MFVCCECCALSVRGLCDGLITRPEESYRLWRVVVCDQETSKNEEAKARYRAVKIQPQWVERQENNKYPIYNHNWRNSLVLFIYITRVASNEIFSPSNKIYREVGRAKDLSATWYTFVGTPLDEGSVSRTAHVTNIPCFRRYSNPHSQKRCAAELQLIKHVATRIGVGMRTNKQYFMFY
jgi:hypothetical protein